MSSGVGSVEEVNGAAVTDVASLVPTAELSEASTQLPQTEDAAAMRQEEEVAFEVSVRTLHGGGSVVLQVSPLDTVQDVRQYLLETPETSDLTSYSLSLDGRPINDYIELSGIEGLKPGATLVMSPEPYNKRTALLHIRRLREIISYHLVNFANTPSPSLFSHFCPSESFDDAGAQSQVVAASSSASTLEAAPAPRRLAKGGSKKNIQSAKKGVTTANSAPAARKSKESNAPKGKQNAELADESLGDDFNYVSLANFYPPANENEPQCVKSIEFAGWNPPPGNRALLGDLYYLQVTTLEGLAIFITSWTHGFFINCCTETTFNPKPATKHCTSHSLSGVLSQASPQFKKNFQQVLRSGQFGRHAFELMAVSTPLTPWVGFEGPHVYDKNRAEYAVLYTEMDFAGNMRDWNEEYQACKELPSSTVQERIVRDRAIFKVHNDFVDAATRGAMAIAGHSVLPINPHEPARFHLFVYNNIFFSFCYDHRDPDFEPLQPPPAPNNAAQKEEEEKYTEQATYVSASNDLKGIRLYNEADVNGLGTVLTALIDYRGHRLLAQSLIPGVLQREETNLAYGSMDNGKTVYDDPQFHELMKQAALYAHIKEYELVDASGKTAKIACPINAKGIVGTDGRKYLIDLGRVMPIDTNWNGQQSQNANVGKGLLIHPSSEPLLRPELVSVFCDALELRLQHQGTDDLTIVLQDETGEENDGTQAIKIDLSSAVLTLNTDSSSSSDESSKDAVASDNPAPDFVTQPASEGNTITESSHSSNDESTEKRQEEGKKYVITINPNVLHHNLEARLTAPSQEIEKDEALVKTLGTFLKDSILPRMAEEFVHFLATPVDGQTLTSIMHQNGVNIRYLGSLAHLCHTRPFLLRLCEQEMLVRVAKHEFNRYIREIEDHLLGPAIAHFLNCLFGDAKASQGRPKHHIFEDDNNSADAMGVFPPQTGNGSTSGKAKKSKKTTKDEPRSNNVPSKGKIFLLTSQTLWPTLKQLVGERFRYTFASVKDESDPRHHVRSLAAVRSFCQKAGVQIAARHYELASDAPFKERDILEAFPIIKHLDPKSRDGQQLLDAGKVFLSQGRLDVAFELFNEALAIFHQVYGPLHPDTALCYGNLAMVHYHANDTTQAIAHQKKMVIINERVHGLDHHDTAHSYGNLALFTRDLKKDSLIPAALRCLKRAHYLASLVCGPHHPDAPNTLMHMGTMYQDLGRAAVALRYYQEALKSNQYFFGEEENLQTGQICHCIALAYSTLDNFKEALNWEKRNYNILAKLVGEKDFRTTESNIWLKQFTRKAVQMQIEAKKAQRDITSSLSQEKIEKLSKQAARGKGAAQKPSSSAPIHSKPSFKI